jgi:hypothetical protein
MLGKLKIRCINNKNGCQEILLLDYLENHEKTCRFDKPLCDKCLCILSVDHNCVESLLESKQVLIESNNQLIENNNKLKEELNLGNDKIISLNSEIENYLRTIQELTNANEAQNIAKTENEVCFQIISIFKIID